MAQMQRLRGRATARVEVDRFLFFEGVEDEVEVAVRKDNAAAPERVRSVASDSFEALDQLFVDKRDAELVGLDWFRGVCARGGGGG